MTQSVQAIKSLKHFQMWIVGINPAVPKGVKQRFPELVQKEAFLVDVYFIGPIIDQTGKEFGQIFLGR